VVNVEVIGGVRDGEEIGNFVGNVVLDNAAEIRDVVGNGVVYNAVEIADQAGNA